MLIVVSKVKAAAKAVGFRCGIEVCEALNKVATDVLIAAAKAAKADGRATIKERDIPKITIG